MIKKVGNFFRFTLVIAFVVIAIVSSPFLLMFGLEKLVTLPSTIRSQWSNPADSNSISIRVVEDKIWIFKVSATKAEIEKGLEGFKVLVGDGKSVSDLSLFEGDLEGKMLYCFPSDSSVVSPQGISDFYLSQLGEAETLKVEKEGEFRLKCKR